MTACKCESKRETFRKTIKNKFIFIVLGKWILFSEKWYYTLSRFIGVKMLRYYQISAL